MAILQILTILFLIIVVILSVIIGSRAQQKEKEVTERRVQQLQLSNRADRVEAHIRGLKELNTDSIATDVLYEYYLGTLQELLQYTDDVERIEVRIAKAEEDRNADPIVFNPEPNVMTFQEKTNYKERLTKLAKMLLFLRRKGRISHAHYQTCYDYLRWLNLWIQLNRQLVQANKNFVNGDKRVAQTLYSVVLSHVKSDSIERPEKKALKTFVEERMAAIQAEKANATTIKKPDIPEKSINPVVKKKKIEDDMEEEIDD